MRDRSFWGRLSVLAGVWEWGMGNGGQEMEREIQSWPFFLFGCFFSTCIGKWKLEKTPTMLFWDRFFFGEKRQPNKIPTYAGEGKGGVC